MSAAHTPGPIALACRAASDGAYRMRFPDFTDKPQYLITAPMSLGHALELLKRPLNSDASLQRKTNGKWVTVDPRAALAEAGVKS